MLEVLVEDWVRGWAEASLSSLASLQRKIGADYSMSRGCMMILYVVLRCHPLRLDLPPSVIHDHPSAWGTSYVYAAGC